MNSGKVVIASRRRSNLWDCRVAPAGLLAMTEKTGFSLLEIIVSLVILSTLAAGIFATVSFAKRVSTQAQQKAVAVSLIESRLSELKSKGAANLDPVKSVQDPLGVAALTTCPECPGCSNEEKLLYCEPINEFNGRMTGLVMANVADDPSSPGSQFIVLVVAKWTDFTVSGNRIRTESAVTVM